MYLIFLIVFVGVAIFLGILWNKNVLKDYPGEKGTQKIISMALFIAAIVIIYSVTYGGIATNSAIKKYSVELENYVYANEQIPDFVKEGLNMTAVSANINEVNKYVAGLKDAMWPHADGLGIPKYFYNWAADYVTKYIQVRLVGLNTAETVALVFVDDNNYITVKSLLGTLRVAIMKVINVIIWVVIIIVLVIVGIFVLVTLNTVSKERKRLAGEAGPLAA